MADLLLCARAIHTLAPARPQVQALGIRDGRILALGTPREVRAALHRPRELDLGDAVAVPGLVDAHGHLVLLGRLATDLDLSGADGPEALASRVRERLAAHPTGTWLRGRGWDQNLFPDGRLPDRQALDALVPTTPIFLERIDAHAALVNGVALRLAGIDRNTEDPQGGRIVRNASGEPTGVLLDAAMEQVARVIPEPGPAALEQQLALALARCAASGLVAVHDAGMDRDVFEALVRLQSQGPLPLRVFAMARWGEPRFEEALARGPETCGDLQLRTVKFFLDGALGSRGAALFEDYADEPGNRGLDTGPTDLAAAFARVTARGFQLACHVIGDRACARALDALESMDGEGRRALRPRLEHLQVVRPQDLARAARLGVVASMQPVHHTSDASWVPDRLGSARLDHAYAWRAVLSAGLPLAFGSDFPIEPPDPLLGLWAATSRSGPQRLTREEALAAYTTGAAWAVFEESQAGRLAPGRRADVSVFDRDLFEAPLDVLGEARPILTMVGGRPSP